MTPMKAIRAKCLDCMCGSSNEVKLCPSDDCSLFLYRFGKRPRKHDEKTGKVVKRPMTPKQQEALKKLVLAGKNKKINAN